MNPELFTPGAPVPAGHHLAAACDALDQAVIDLIEALSRHYPEEAASLRAGVRIEVKTADGKADHIFRMKAAR